MKKFFICADRWVSESGWRDVALLKLCVGSLGILLGMAVPSKKRLPVTLVTVAVAVVTWPLLVGKFLGIVADEVGKPCTKEDK